MTKVDIFSGFLGAGKTTLIKKLISEAYAGEKLVLIENEFGEIGIDGGFLKEAGIEITEMNSGCICCSLVGDFGRALEMVTERFSPDRVIIEPSGVGKLSDVAQAVLAAGEKSGMELGSMITVADALRCRMFIKNFGEFYNDQIASAGAIVLSRTDKMTEQQLSACVHQLREINDRAVIVTTPWGEITGAQILAAADGSSGVASLIEEVEHEHYEHCCHEHEHEHHEHCCHEHEHDHDHDHEHEHEHEHCCHEHDHDHDADEIFTSCGYETPNSYDFDRLKEILAALEDEARFGTVLRAKGIVPDGNGKWLHFDYVPGEAEIRYGSAEVTGRLCVIGARLNTDAVAELFGI